MEPWWLAQHAYLVPPVETSLVLETGCATSSVCVLMELSSKYKWQARTWAAKSQTTPVATLIRRTWEVIHMFTSWLFLRMHANHVFTEFVITGNYFICRALLYLLYVIFIFKTFSENLNSTSWSCTDLQIIVLKNNYQKEIK